MRQSKKFLIIIFCFIQPIFGCYYTCDGYSQFADYAPFHTPFSDNLIHFNVNLFPEPAQSRLPLVNLDSCKDNYNRLIDCPVLFQDEQQSNINYSFEVTVNQSSGTPFALMPTRKLASDLIAVDCNQEKVIEGYYVYYPDTVKESVPIQQTIRIKKADLHLIHEWRQSLRLHEHYGSESAQRFKNRIGAISDRVLVDGQLAIERLLIQEADDLIRIIETDRNPLIREHVGSLRQCVTAAREFIKLKQIKTAATILDFCWSFTELATALVKAATQGLANAAINARDHPVELALVLTASVFAPQVLCAYHAYQMICYLAPIAKDLAEIGMTYWHDETEGLNDFKTYISPLTTFVDRIQNKEISLTQLLESGTMIAAQHYAEQKLYGGLSGLFGSIKDKAIAWVAKNPSLKFAHYLKTPEGLLFKTAQGAQDGSFKERVTQTLHRTEDFFKETEFGKANEKYFKRTIYGHRPHRAFQAMKNFDYIKKKQFIVLDGLHKNHLELYDSNMNWLKVINFDGTLNEQLTAKALRGDQRQPLSILG